MGRTPLGASSAVSIFSIHDSYNNLTSHRIITYRFACAATARGPSVRDVSRRGPSSPLIPMEKPPIGWPFHWQGQKDSPLVRCALPLRDARAPRGYFLAMLGARSLPRSPAAKNADTAALSLRTFESFHICPQSKPKAPKWVLLALAGAEGLEPSRTVLETAMLPLHHAPKRNSRIIASPFLRVKQIVRYNRAGSGTQSFRSPRR